jgi:hypothetical protein
MDENDDQSEDLLRKEYENLLAGDWNSHNDPRLLYPTALDKMPMPEYKKVKIILDVLYKSHNSAHRRAASILNALFSQKTSIFIMTKKHFFDLATKDPNQDLKSGDSAAYKALVSFLLSKGILETIKEPSRFGENGPRRAGVYRLIDKKLVHQLDILVGETYRKNHEALFVKWQEETDYDGSGDLTPEQLALYNKMEQQAAEKRSKREQETE